VLLQNLGKSGRICNSWLVVCITTNYYIVFYHFNKS